MLMTHNTFLVKFNSNKSCTTDACSQGLQGALLLKRINFESGQSGGFE